MSSTGISFSVLTAEVGNTQKRIIPGPAGRPGKDPNHSLGISKGTVAPVAVDDLHGFAAVLRTIAPNQALTLGVTGSDRAQTVVTAEKLESLQRLKAIVDDGGLGGYVSRSLKYFSWPADDYFFILLDHDPEPGQAPMLAGEFWSAFCEVMPEFATAGRVVTVSSSSAIYDKATGECLKPASGHHTYVAVKGDVERFKAILEARCWLHGEAFFKLATPNKATGVAAVLERFIVDRAVFSPERLVYEAGAEIDPRAPFEQRLPAPQVVEGDYIDLDAIPDLTEAEQAQAAANRKQARDAIAPQRLDKVVEHIATAQPDLKPVEVKREAKRLITQCDRGHLSPEHPLYLADGRTITAGDIGPEHHGVQLSDPQEPDYRGGALTAKIYCEQPGKWTIHSFAHGGKVYRPAGAKSAGTPRKPPKNHAPAAAIAESIGHSQGDPIEALREHYRPREMAPDFVISSGDGLTPEAKAVLDANPMAFITGMTGSGKTSTILDWTAAYTKENPGETTDFVAPTNNLAGGLTVEAATRGIDATLLRDRIGSSAGVSPGLATESLYRESGRSGYVFDEITAQTRRLLQGNLGEAADQNLTAFNKILVSCDRLSMLDANIPPEVRAYAEAERGEKIPLIKVERAFPEKETVNVTTYADTWVMPDGDGKPFFASGKAAMLEEMDSTIRAGGKVLLLSGGADFANELKQHYRKQRKASGMRVRVLEVDGDTTPEAVRLEFAADPTAFIARHNCDVVIVTRLAETGANIKNEFDSVYVALTLGQTATEANQLMSRARCLFQGSCNDLHIYFPGEAGSHPTEGDDDDAATLAQSIDWKWQQAQIIKEHQATLNTLAGGLTPGDEAGIKSLGYVVANQARLGLAIETLAKMQAREAAEKHWRMDYLLGMLRDRGFNVAAEPTTDDGTATKKWLAKGSDKTAPGLLTIHREANKKTKANCRARGKRLQSEYADRYQDKLSDPREQGWILRQKRQQLKDAGDFPLSPLDTAWHLANIENDRLRPQAKCRALLMVPGEGVAILRQRTVAEIMGSQLGFLEIHKRLHRHEIHRLALMQKFSASTLLTGILNNKLYAEWTVATPGAAQLAQMIRQHSADLEMYCAREYGTPFVWDEKSDIALINKFWKLLLGFQVEQRGQRTVEGKRVRVYGLEGLSERAKEMTDSHVMALLNRLNSIECEAGDWNATSPDWEPVQALLTTCTLKSMPLDNQDFSVQAPLSGGAPERSEPKTEHDPPKNQTIQSGSFLDELAEAGSFDGWVKRQEGLRNE